MVEFVEAHGAKIPRIGLGTWPMSGRSCSRAVASALQTGYRHIDTAAMYGNEAAVGNGIRESGIGRDEIFVTTKVWSTDIGSGDLQRSAEASVAKLGIDQVDLLLIHWPNAAIPIEESIAALCDAKTSGLTRHIGISNFPTALMDAAVAATSEPIVCNQIEYHPFLDQSQVIAACRRHGMAVVSYCPLGRGGAGGLFRDKDVAGIARSHGKTPAQIILRWHIEQDGVTAIPKSADPARQKENLDVFGFSLKQAEIATISELVRRRGRIVDMAAGPDWD